MMKKFARITKPCGVGAETKSDRRPLTPPALQACLTWSPPTSSDPDDRPVLATEECGMVIHNGPLHHDHDRDREATARVKPSNNRSQRRKLQYVSRHFQPQQTETRLEVGRTRKKRRVANDKENVNLNGLTTPDSESCVELERHVSSLARPVRDSGVTEQISQRVDGHSEQQDNYTAAGVVLLETEPNVGSVSHTRATDTQACNAVPARTTDDVTCSPRVFFGLNVDDLSSDSELSDPPSDFDEDSDPLTTSSAVEGKRPDSVPHKKPSKRKSGLTKSPYFPHAHKPRPQFLSTLPFPPIHLPHFGLMQEKLAHDPFRLLLATIFLNKTPGQRAMPVFYKLMAEYPTPKDLANAKQSDVTAIIQCLGFQNQRAVKCIAMAKMWCERPPACGKRYRKLHYPCKGDGKDIKEDEVLGDEDDEGGQVQGDAEGKGEALETSNRRVAWEISHLPGIGAYGHDSWRMFCRDQLRGLSSGWNGEKPVQQNDAAFEPEWKRVLPLDKELRAWMTWMWMKEGWIWDKETGKKTKASEELMALARGEGNVVLESGESVLEIKPLSHDAYAWMPKVEQGTMVARTEDLGVVQVTAPAGDFVPE